MRYMTSSLKDTSPHKPPEKVLSFSSYCRWKKRGTERLSTNPNTAQLAEPCYLTLESISDPLEPVLLIALAHPLPLSQRKYCKAGEWRKQLSLMERKVLSAGPL